MIHQPDRDEHFTHLTDLSGYDGAFTPGHLWFILFLFLISLAALPVLQAIPYEKCSEFAQKIPVPAAHNARLSPPEQKEAA